MYISLQPKTDFWFMPDTNTETEVGFIYILDNSNSSSISFWTKVLFRDGYNGKTFVYKFCVLCILVNRLYTVIHNTQNSLTKVLPLQQSVNSTLEIFQPIKKVMRLWLLSFDKTSS